MDFFYCRHWIFPRFDPKKLSFPRRTKENKGKERKTSLAEDNSNFPELEKGNGTLLPSLLIRTEITPLLFSFLFWPWAIKKLLSPLPGKIKEGRKGRKKTFSGASCHTTVLFPKKKFASDCGKFICNFVVDEWLFLRKPIPLSQLEKLVKKRYFSFLQN